MQPFKTDFRLVVEAEADASESQSDVGLREHPNADYLSYVADLIFEMQLMTSERGYNSLADKLSSAHVEALAQISAIRRN